jgi:histidyl-tRNA synthetase
MSQLQPVRGTHDILPEESRKRRFIVESALSLAENYGYGEISTPVFEFSDVFHRTLGDTSDVVTKETYTFTDRGGESLTLRPEFTAGVARAFISGGMQQDLPCKFFYYGPAFRYERPQKGRMRQFHQLGVELLGAAEPQADIEVIALAWQLFGKLGLQKHVVLEINTLGDAASRAAYRAALVEYFSAHKAELSEDSQIRLEKNPLRILDSKDEGDKKITANAPTMQEHFTEEARAFFAAVCAGLDRLGIPYKHSARLVRGLDYYNHTVFEFTSDLLGAQSTVLAGGRYDGLISTMGGPATPGVGWASGIERLLMVVDFDSLSGYAAQTRPVALVPLGDAANGALQELAYRLRGAGLAVEMAYSGNLGKRMKRADKRNACIALIMGDNELERKVVQYKVLDSGEQKELSLTEVEAELLAALAQPTKK